MLKMKNEKNYLGFLLHKIWQILKHFSRALSWAQTFYFWAVLFNLPESMKVMYERVAPSLQENASVKCQEYLDNIQLVVFQRQTMIWNCSRENSIVQDMAAML